MSSAARYLNPGSVALKIYPRANENRKSGHDPSVHAPRRNFLKAAGINFLLLQLLFLGLFSYLFGSLFQQDSHVHNLNIVFVDYDGGIIGNSVRDAYTTLQGSGFPTLIERPATEYATPQNLEEAVCQSRFWAALYTTPGASSRLQAALSGGSTYNNSDVLAYIWNEARWAAIVDSLIAQNIETLSSAARIAYSSNETEARQAVSANTSTALSAFVNPWQIVSVNIQPTTQGSRLIYNTLVIILILIQEFFYLGTINGLYLRYEIFARLRPRRIVLYRIGISAAYTFSGALCTTGAIWAFRDTWHVNSNQFALTWAILWLFAHANFLTFDVFSVWLPAPYVPMSLITWIVFNVTSILIPLELMPGFYKWSYAMPANAVFRTLIDIWSGGCNPQLYYTLPILFSLEVVSLTLSCLGVYRRCHLALVAEEAQQKAFRDRVDAALSFEREREKETHVENPAAEELLHTGTEQTSVQEADERGESRLVEVMRREDERLRREQTRTNQGAQYGPCFDIAFSNSDD